MKKLSILLALSIMAAFIPVSNAQTTYFDTPITVTYTAQAVNTWTAVADRHEPGDAIYADRDYVFTIGTEKFTLLDVLNDSNSKYFVIANQSYGTRTVTYADGVFKMPTQAEIDAATTDPLKDQLDAKYFAYWLNNGFIKFGHINRDIISHVDYNHIWTCEPAPNAGTPITQYYTYTAGVSIPSMSELKAYKDRVGYKDVGGNFMTRTVVNWNNAGAATNYIFVAGGHPDNTAVGWRGAHWSLPAVTNIRPCFYLNNKLFEDVRINLDTAGAAVKQEIKKVDVEKLIELYTPEELEAYLDVTIPDGTIILNNIRVETRSGNDAAYGETLVAKYHYNSGSSYGEKSAEITWKKTDGSVTTVLGTGKTYIVTEADANTGTTQIYFDIKVKDVLGNESELKTSAHVTIPGLGVVPVAPNAWKHMKVASEAADRFIIDGKSFTLVKSFDNDESTFFVAPNDNYGRKGLTSVYMNPNDDENIIHWLNHSFKENGNSGNQFPQSIINHINYNHIWLTEGAPNNAIVSTGTRPEMAANYTYKAGISLISFGELSRYNDVLGSVEGIGGSYFTRTAANWKPAEGSSEQYILCGKNALSGSNPIVQVNHWPLPTENAFRPVFYLTKDFFKNVQLDWDNVGANVITAMTKIYNVEDLEDLYQENELLDKGFIRRCSVDAYFTKFGDITDVLEALTGADSIQAVVDVTTAKAGIDMTAVFAIYDGSGKMVAVNSAEITSDTTQADVTFGFESLSGITEGHYAKIIMLDNQEFLKPVTKALCFDSDLILQFASAVNYINSTNSFNRGNNFLALSQL